MGDVICATRHGGSTIAEIGGTRFVVVVVAAVVAVVVVDVVVVVVVAIAAGLAFLLCAWVAAQFHSELIGAGRDDDAPRSHCAKVLLWVLCIPLDTSPTVAVVVILKQSPSWLLR
jgi:hypothetical protein